MFTPSYHPRVGGVEKHVRRVSSLMAEDGHDVTIVTPSSDSGVDVDGMLRVERYPPGPLGSFSWAKTHLDMIKSADVLHFHDHAIFVSFSFLRFLLPRKTMTITFHGYEGIVPVPKRFILSRRLCDLLCRANISVGHYIGKWYGTNIDNVSYGGCDVMEVIPDKCKNAAFIGRLDEDTGIRECLQAIGVLQAEMEFPLDVYGDGPLAEELHLIAVEKGLDVEFKGAVPDAAKLLGEYRFSFTNGYLGMWESLALASSLLTVHSNELKKDYLSGFPGADDCFMVCSSAESLRDSAKLLMDNEEMAQDMRQRGLSLAHQNSWSKVRDLYYEIWGVTE